MILLVLLQVVGGCLHATTNAKFSAVRKNFAGRGLKSAGREDLSLAISILADRACKVHSRILSRTFQLIPLFYSSLGIALWIACYYNSIPALSAIAVGCAYDFLRAREETPRAGPCY
jgi:hypothetical protein